MSNKYTHKTRRDETETRQNNTQYNKYYTTDALSARDTHTPASPPPTSIAIALIATYRPYTTSIFELTN